MKTTVVGAYPKISDEHQDLRRALHRVDRGELDESGIADVFDGTTAWAIGELADAGVDIINDGQVRWDDLLAPFAKAWRNCERGPLERFYDNNTYFRQPIIKGPIETDGQTLVRDFKFADSTPHGKASMKGAVCGPLTFATLTAHDTHYKDLETRTLAAADALAKELAGLKAAGAMIVDVEEPALAAHPELIDLERAALGRLTRGGVTVALYPYFFPIDRIIEKLDVAPVGVLGIDVRSRETSHKAIERLGAFKGTVSLGVVDGRNTRIETQREIADLVDAALKRVGDERRLYLSTTTGLEYLPHDVALRKLGALTDAARSLEGVRS